MNKKMTSAIGLAYASKNIILGTDLIVGKMRSEEVDLVVMSTKAGYNTQKLIMDKCDYYKVDVVIVDESDVSVLSRALGGRNVVVLGIKKSGFKKMILNVVS